MKEPSVGVGVRQPELPGIDDPRYRFRNAVLGFAKINEPATPNDSEPVYDPDFVTQENGLPVSPADGAIFRVTPLFRTLQAGKASVVAADTVVTSTVSTSRLVLDNDSDYWIRVRYNGNDTQLEPRGTLTLETPLGSSATLTLNKLDGLPLVGASVNYQFMGW